MEENIAIQKLSEKLGLTSRTLRHWEAEGLIQSGRDPVSGWRSYDSHSVLCIKLTALFRSYGIALKDIKRILDSGSCETLSAVVRKYLDALKDRKCQNESWEKSLKALLTSLKPLEGGHLPLAGLHQMLAAIPIITDAQSKEDHPMMNAAADLAVRFITLPAMRAAYYIAVSVSPEDEALKAVTGWLKEQNLGGTARIFGGDMPPMPSGANKPYGYGVMASIPEGVPVPVPLEEKRFPGGLYAVTESTDDIGGSWRSFMQYLSRHEEYAPDSSRLCLEEHIRSDAPEDSGREYFLHLMEPVKRR